MKKLLTILEALFLIALFTASGYGVTRTSTQTGLWSATNTWVGGVAPGSGDDAVIANGHVVTLNADASITNCTVNTGGSLVAGTSGTTVTLTVSGTFTLQSGGTFTQGGTVKTVPGISRAFDPASTFIFNGTQTGITDFVTFGNLTWSSTHSATLGGDLIVAGNLTLLNSDELDGSFGGSRTHNISGNILIDGGVAVLGGAGPGVTGTVTWNVGKNLTSQNGGFLVGIAALAFASPVFNISRDVNCDIGVGSAGTNTFSLNFVGSTSQSFTGSSIFTQDITFNNSAGVVLGAGANVNLYGTINLVSGVVDNSAGIFTLSSGSTINRSGGSLATAPTFPTGIIVEYTGSVTTSNELPTVAGDLGDLVINASGGVTLGASATVNGSLKLFSGKLTLGSNNLTLASANPIVGASSSNYIVTNSTGYMIQNVSSSNVTFPVGTASTYNPVILNNTGGTPDNYSVRVAGSTANVVSLSGVVSDQWTINESSAGGSNIVMTLQWNVGEEGGSFTPRSSGQIGRYIGGTSWAPMATTVSESGPYTASNNLAITGNFSNSVYGVGLSAALPVELTSFTATPRTGKVELAWTTASEINNYGFEVERKTINNDSRIEHGTLGSAQSAMNNWEKIGFVEGHGSTNAPQDYSFTDAAARVGKYSYRLKQIDRDGKFEHHQAVEVTLGITPNTVWLDNNYPNPFNPSTKISFVLGTTGNASLKVFDLLGKEVVTLAEGIFNSGELQSFTFDATKYASGIYYYQLKSGTQTEMKKMLLLK